MAVAALQRGMLALQREFAQVMVKAFAICIQTIVACQTFLTEHMVVNRQEFRFQLVVAVLADDLVKRGDRFLMAVRARKGSPIVHLLMSSERVSNFLVGEIFKIEKSQRGLRPIMFRMTVVAGCFFPFCQHDVMKLRWIMRELGMADQATVPHLLA